MLSSALPERLFGGEIGVRCNGEKLCVVGEPSALLRGERLYVVVVGTLRGIWLNGETIEL